MKTSHEKPKWVNDPEPMDEEERRRLISQAIQDIKNMDSDKLDAERYRWLRDHSYIELFFDSPREPNWHPEKLDIAIDTELNKETK